VSFCFRWQRHTVHHNGKGHVDYTVDAAGNTTSFGYDPATGRRIAVANIDYSAANTPDVFFRYDRLGGQTNVVDGTGARFLTYDNDTLRLHAETNWIGYITRYYDAHGRSDGFGVDGIHDVAYDFDDVSLLPLRRVEPDQGDRGGEWIGVTS